MHLIRQILKNLEFFLILFPKLIRNLVLEQAEIRLKYEGYIEKESEIVNKFVKLENVFLKEDFDYYLGVPLNGSQTKTIQD